MELDTGSEGEEREKSTVAAGLVDGLEDKECEIVGCDLHREVS